MARVAIVTGGTRGIGRETARRLLEAGARVTISHDTFTGFMDAMAMPFDLKDAARDTPVTPGDRVRFRLSIKGSRSWVDRLEIISAARRDAGQCACASHRRPARPWRRRRRARRAERQGVVRVASCRYARPLK